MKYLLLITLLFSFSLMANAGEGETLNPDACDTANSPREVVQSDDSPKEPVEGADGDSGEI